MANVSDASVEHGLDGSVLFRTSDGAGSTLAADEAAILRVG